MIVVLGFLSLLMVAFAGWLISETVRARPWVADSASAAQASALPSGFTAPRVGLVVFLGVVCSLFAMSISAYKMRMVIGSDWQTLPEPAILWLNTALLVAGSVALQMAWNAARRAERRRVAFTLALGGVLTVAFIIGQLVAWRGLVEAGYFATANPAYAFFYLITALHALHMLGGLFALGRSGLRFWRGAAPEAMRASLELCAVYWHFLLLLWFALYWLLLTT